jgi:hypothetical protein
MKGSRYRPGWFGTGNQTHLNRDLQGNYCTSLAEKTEGEPTAVSSDDVDLLRQLVDRQIGSARSGAHPATFDPEVIVGRDGIGYMATREGAWYFQVDLWRSGSRRPLRNPRRYFKGRHDLFVTDLVTAQLKR